MPFPSQAISWAYTFDVLQRYILALLLIRSAPGPLLFLYCSLFLAHARESVSTRALLSLLRIIINSLMILLLIFSSPLMLLSCNSPQEECLAVVGHQDGW